MDEQIQSPFFILGIPRSGTTLLEQMLDAHSQVGVTHELSIGTVLWRLNACHFVKNQWIAIMILNYFYNRTKDLTEPMADCLAIQALRPIKYPIKTKDWFDLLISDYLVKKEALLFGEKTPENTFFIPTLKSVFPESKYVIILRNPLDIVLSICEMAILKLKVPITNRLLLQFAVLVKRGLADIYKNNDLPSKQNLVIKYEDLVLDTEHTLKMICGFLEIEYQSVMRDNFEQVDKFSANQDLMKKVFGMANEVITNDRINRSLSSLRSEQVSFLYTYLSPEISYSPYEVKVNDEPISIGIYIRVYLAKISFFLKVFMVDEYRKKVRYQLHYYAIRFFKNTRFNSFIFKNLKWKKRDWEMVLEQRSNK